MKNKYKILLSILIMFSLVGCTSEKINENVLTNTEELILDRNIEVDNNLDVGSRIVGNARKFEIKDISKSVLGTSELEYIDSNEYSSSGKYKDKNIFIPQDGNFMIQTETFDMITTIALEIQGNSQIVKPSKVFKDKELQFDSIKNSINKCKSTLDDLNIEYNETPEVYGLDCEGLQKKQDILMEDPYFKSDVESGKIKIKDKWSKEDEGYYIIFNTELNNIKIDPIEYENKENGYISEGSKVVFWVNKFGVDSVCVEGNIYESKKIGEKDALIDVEKSIEIIQEKYEDIILSGDNTIENVELLYVPIVEDVDIDKNGGIFINKYEFEPCWVFKIKNKIVMRNGEEKYVYGFERISAITGKFVE